MPARNFPPIRIGPSRGRHDHASCPALGKARIGTPHRCPCGGRMLKWRAARPLSWPRDWLICAGARHETWRILGDTMVWRREFLLVGLISAICLASPALAEPTRDAVMDG